MLELNNIGRLESFGARYNFKLHLRTFLQAAVTVSLDSGKVDENVLPTLSLNETIAFACVKPLYSSLLAIVTHVYFYSFW